MSHGTATSPDTVYRRAAVTRRRCARRRYVLQPVFLGSFAMGSCAILALATVFVGHAEAQIVRREARLKPARRPALAPHLPRP